MKNKYKISLTIIAMLIILNVMVLTHYELWMMANNSEYIAINTSGCINIIYSDDQDVLMINPKALSEEDGISNLPNTITINNTCKQSESISLYVDLYNDSTISDNKIKVNVNGDIIIKTKYLSETNKIFGTDNILSSYKLLNVSMNPGETKRINLRFWLDENEIITPETNTFHANYYIVSDQIDSKSNFKETIINNNEIKESDGLIKVDDNYYFNGNVENNYIRFADLDWRIISINEDNSIKVIYADNDLQSVFNNDLYTESKVSYDDSKIKEYLDNFYNEKLINYDKYIKKSKYVIDTSYEASWRTTYGSYKRNFVDYSPSIASFETDKEYGGVKEYKIGLITLDEAALAGASTNANNEYYLYSGVDYYTMSPASYNGVCYVGTINRYGKLDATRVSDNIVVKPVINIDGAVIVNGEGTQANPYLVVD